MAAFLLWCLLFVVCWPLALVALILYPIVWLLLLPFRIVGIAIHGVLALITAVIMLGAIAERTVPVGACGVKHAARGVPWHEYQ